jgi:type I restriction enzyme S subunit
MSEWKEYKLADVAIDFAMGPFGSNIKAENFIEYGVPVIRGKNLNFNKYVDGDFVYLSDAKANELEKSNCFPDDLVFTHRGTIGQVGIIPKGKFPRYVVSQSGMKLTVDKNVLDENYLFYFFKSDIGQYELLKNESQVGVPAISSPLSSLKSIDLKLPPLPEQKAIASVLSSLDDKIDLLHRQNKTLEAMAETLFRQWFVEEAQDDWEENSLHEVIQLVGGGTPKTSIAEYWDGDIPWLAGGDIAANHKSFISYSEKRITKVGLNNSSAKLLPKYSTVISARGTVGKYCLLAQPMAFSQSNYGILPNISECFFFTYLLINHVVEELQSSAYGSVFDTITTTTFKEIKVTFPTETEIFRFERSVSPYFEKMLLNKFQINTLEKLRDTLLPKLMSGEVRVKI